MNWTVGRLLLRIFQKLVADFTLITWEIHVWLWEKYEIEMKYDCLRLLAPQFGLQRLAFEILENLPKSGIVLPTMPEVGGRNRIDIPG